MRALSTALHSVIGCLEAARAAQVTIAARVLYGQAQEGVLITMSKVGLGKVFFILQMLQTRLLLMLILCAVSWI